MSEVGTVYGVGVGPGDPELLTLKALRIIQGAPVLAYAAAEGVPSFARSIVEPHLSDLPAKTEIPMVMPMVAERFPAQDVYDRGAEDIRQHLQAGRDVAVLCEGDPMFYGSFMYLFGRLNGAFPMTVVPGVSSVMACAAVAGWPLVARNDAFRVLPATLDDDALRQQIKDAEALAFMKVGRHLGRLKALLSEAGLLGHAVYVERASLPTQRVVPLLDLDEDRAPTSQWFWFIDAEARMSFKPQDILFVSPLDRHADALNAVRDALGGGEVRCGAGFSEAVRQGFGTGRPVVGLCAAGILIRLVAPLLTDKHAEPPVLVMTETGDFVPLLGGHHGANRLARDLAEAANGFALVSTATDALLGAPVEDPAPGYRLLNPQDAGAFQKALAQSPTAVAIKGEWPLRSEVPEVSDPSSGLSLGTEGEPSQSALVYTRTDLVLGVGCERGADADALVDAVQELLAQSNLRAEQVAGIASVTLKQDEPALAALSDALSAPLRFFEADRLAQVSTPNPSTVVQAEIGTPSVSEAAALLGAGEGASLVLEKQKFGIGTLAIARAPQPITAFTAGQARGQVQLVGLGPGREDWRLAGTDAVLRSAEHLVGYTYYTDQVHPLPHQQVHTFDLGEEERRCQFALDLAAEGKSVALICSGDAGVYAMGALVYELADRSDSRAVQGVEIIANPGISAMFGAAARLGAPLGHDFCAISLSNLMTPWTVIERRLQGASAADFVVCFYNPVSRKRDWQLAAARDILLENRPAETPVVICRQIGRAEETFTHRTLGELDPAEVDMFCMVLVGSSITRRYQPVKNGPISLYTPRGYLSRGEDHRA